MTATTAAPEPMTSEDPTPAESSFQGKADLSLLQDRTPDWAKVSRKASILALGLALLFLYFSFMPLWHTDVWGHLTYGRWITEHKTLPTTEPLLPLYEGVRFVDTAWLSQVLGYLAWKQAGVTVLQFLSAAGVTLCAGLLAITAVRRTGSILAGWVALLAFVLVDYQQLIIARPQTAGLVCFVITFAILTSLKWRPIDWVALPALFALWANLHGSFPTGLILIGAFGVGRAIDLLRHTGQLRSLWHDRTLIRLVLVGQLCAVAALINPYGLELYLETIRISSNRNLQDLVEWDSLTLRMKQGQAAAVAVLSLILLLRSSPRRVAGGEAVSLILFGLAACWSSRMIVWFAPVCAYFLALHAAAAVAHWRRHEPAQPVVRSGLSTVLMLAVLWISFAYSPFGMRVLHGAPKTPEADEQRLRRSTSAQTPIAAVKYLNEHPPVGLVFNTYEIGDYLMWAGPSGAQWFLNSHAHLIPREIWEDYLRISGATVDWSRKLDRFGVNTIVLDKTLSPELTRALKDETATWTLDYEDQFNVIYLRKKPI